MKASNEFEKAIADYLESVKSNYPQLSEAIVQEGKSITECCSYIIQEVQKKKVNAMADLEVFQLAEAYYLAEKVEVKKVNCKVVVPGKETEESEAKPIAPILLKKPKQKEYHSNQLSLFD